MVLDYDMKLTLLCSHFIPNRYIVRSNLNSPLNPHTEKTLSRTNIIFSLLYFLFFFSFFSSFFSFFFLALKGGVPPTQTAEEAVSVVRSGQRVFVHTAAAAPTRLIKALTARHTELKVSVDGDAVMVDGWR